MDRREHYARQIGTGGANEPMEVWTHGYKRMEVLAGFPAMRCQPATTDPDAPRGTGQGTWFFRDNGSGKSQFCVRFPSGAVQVISTEP
jgi:hypothetical protein